MAVLLLAGLAARRRTGHQDSRHDEPSYLAVPHGDNAKMAPDLVEAISRSIVLEAENRRLMEEIDRLSRLAASPVPAEGDKRLSRELAMMVLGMDPDLALDRKSLRKAYIESVRRNHPDQGGSEHSFRLILQAHEYLTELLGAE